MAATASDECAAIGYWRVRHVANVEGWVRLPLAALVGQSIPDGGARRLATASVWKADDPQGLTSSTLVPSVIEEEAFVKTLP